MGNERGLPSLPRGLSRDLTLYLQSLSEFVLRLSGTVRGSGEARAVRAAEKGTLGGGTAVIGQGAVQSDMLRRGSVTEEKLADGAVTASKLGQSAVTGRAIQPGAVDETALAPGAVGASRIQDDAVNGGKLADRAVTPRHLADGAVTANAMAADAVETRAIRAGAITSAKLAAGLLPILMDGEAKDGQTLRLSGLWQGRPMIALTWFPGNADGQEPAKAIGIMNLREVVDEDGAGTGQWEFDAAGTFRWSAIGYQRGEA